MSQPTLEQNQRIFMALVFFGAALILYQSFFYTPPPRPEAVDPAGVEQAATEEGASSAAVPAEAQPSAVEAAPEVEGEAAALLPPMTMRVGATDDELVLWQVSNEGAAVREVEIVRPSRFIPREDMRGVFPRADEGLPIFAFVMEELGLEATSRFHWDEEASEREGDYWTRLVFRWVSADGTVAVLRTYEQDGRPFAMRATVSVENRGAQPLQLVRPRMEIPGTYTSAAGGMLNPAASVLEAICHQGRRTDRTHARKVGEPERMEGAAWFAGVTERYFLTAVAPRGEDGSPNPTGTCVFRPDPRGAYVVTELVLPHRTVEASETLLVGDFTLYTGPKDRSYLELFPYAFEASVDLGWLTFLAAPIRWLLLFLQGFVLNWGLAIIFLTFIIKLLMWPLTTKSFRSMEKMRELSPKLQELRAKYENDPTKMAEEQMKLFRETGVSPLGGCLPMLLQMPIYLALYQTIWGSAELYQAPFVLWVQDLSRPDPVYLLPILMGAIMFVQQKLMPAAMDNPQMKVIQTVMPIMFTGFMLFLPSGLVLYILANMLLSIAQQLWIRRVLAKERGEVPGATAVRAEPPALTPSAEPKRKKKKR